MEATTQEVPQDTIGQNVSAAPEILEPDAPVIELGDRIRIFGGKYDKTTGRVIYRTVDEIHLLPDGVTNKAIEFTINEEGFDPEYEVESVEILQKRKKPELVEILDLHVDQDLETFGPDGEPLAKYRIVKIQPEDDSIIINNEAEGDVVLNFGFRGVPKDLPFRVIRSRQAPARIAVTNELGEVLEEDLGEATGDGEGDGEGNREGDGEGNREGDGEGEFEPIEEENFTFLDDEIEAETPADEGVEKLIEIPRSERTYSNETQKSEGYSDLLSLNSVALQKLPEVQRSTRVLTEIFFQLRASIIRLAEDGSPVGVRPTSIQTLVDALETRQMLMSRCVIDIDKLLYHDMSSDKDPQPESLDGLKLQNFVDKIVESVTYLESSPDMNGQKFNSFLNGYLARFASSWRESGSPRIAFQRDEEAFRRRAPDSESTIPGFPSGLPAAHKGDVSADIVNEVSMSMVRGLKAIRTKTQVLQLGEEAAVTAYVLFPLAYSTSLSTARQESLIADVQAGMKDIRTMSSILKRLGDITDVPSANSAFLVSVDGGTLGNIPLREYLKALGLRAEGMGDIWPLQVLMGLKEREWTIDQFEVLKESIKETQNQILAEIVRQREVLAQQVSQPPAVQGLQMTPDGPQMIEKLGGEPALREIQDEIKAQMPAFANSDVALVGLLLRQHPELSFAQLADQPAALTRVRLIYARNEYLKTLREKQMLKERIEFAGQAPVAIKCPHVKPLAMIRRVKDNTTRLALLSKFLTTFQGVKDGNWLQCNAGDHNLLCMHELLQIYQYLRPGDVGVLNKEIQLKFGGGQFQGFYICRNCGQPISELDYDTHIEFDDNGRPMMGRSELVDKDAITQENIEDLIGPLGDVEEQPEFDNEAKRLIYTTAKELADKLFAPLEMNDYMTLVGRVYGIIQQIPARDVYVKYQQALRKSKGATAAAVAADYDVYINQALVCAVGVHMLLLIQSRKPDLILRGTPSGCRSLGGQPLEPEGGTQGIQCVLSIISSFQKDTPPWSLTQFQKELDDTRRQKIIMGVFEPILKSALQDPMIQQALSQKRDYRRKVLGAAGGQGRPDEQLPENFAPIPYDMKEEDFVEKIIVPEAASPEDRAELWIRQGNAIAKKNKLPMPLVFNEATCCLSPLQHIDDFWTKAKQSLPPFSKRVGIKAPPKITRAEPTMIPSQIVRPLPDPPENSYYTLFLKVCYDGDKKGYSHEFGLTHKCVWCDLQLPKEVELLTAEQGLSAIEDQGIEVTKESFEDLLNETHRVNSFKTVLLTEIPGPLDNWVSLMEMEPEPAVGYREIMEKTQSALMKLPPNAKEEEVALALSDFSLLVGSLESGCKQRLSNVQNSILDSIANDGAESIIRFLQSYLVVPLKQRISNYTTDTATSIPKSWGLSEQHKNDLAIMMTNHRGYLTKFNRVVFTPWLTAKINSFLVEARSIINKLELIRPLQIPGSKQTYLFFLKFCLFGPLANFVDPNILPMSTTTEIPESHVEQQALFPAKFVADMLGRFKDEGFNLTPEQIRGLIAKRNEMEKANIIKKMNDMSGSGKDIEKIKMKLGLGDWSVGGTKGIYAYDQDRYDIEREQRAQAGIIDFPGQGPEGPGAPGGREVDGLGYYNMGGDEEGYLGDGDLADVMGFDEE